MAKYCDIIPRIQNKEGEWVNSLLFTSLLDNLKDRELAKQAYQKVHSKEFLDWFGDWINNPAEASKVVDENGEPLVVYHGSKSKFSEFDTNASSRFLNDGRGLGRSTMFFTDSFEHAENYSRVMSGTDIMNDEGIPMILGDIYPFDNPSLPLSKEEIKKIDTYLINDGWEDKKIREELIINIEKYLSDDSGEVVMPVFLNSKDLEVIDAKGKGKPQKFFDAIKDTSIDGIFLKNVLDPDLTNIYTVFEPNQIKSISSEGFSKESSNIYAAKEDDSEVKALETKLGLRYKEEKLGRKREFKKNYEKTLVKTQKLNKSGKIPKGYKATIITVKGEKGDDRLYDAIAIVPLFPSQESEKSSIVKEVFGNKRYMSTSEVLNRIVNSSSKPVWKTMSKRLLDLISNDVQIEVISREEMSKYEVSDSEGNLFTPGGVYVGAENKIYIQPNSNVGLIIHEILHGQTTSTLRSSTQAKVKFNKIYEDLKKNHSDKFTSPSNAYAMKDLDEFLVGIFTNPEFASILKSIPSKIKEVSVWDELMNLFSAIFNHFGFSQARGISVFEESMDAAIKVLEESKESSRTSEDIDSLTDEELEMLYGSPETDADPDGWNLFYDLDVAAGEAYTKPGYKKESKEEKKAAQDVKIDDKILADIKDNLLNVKRTLTKRANNETTKNAVERLAILEEKLRKIDGLEAINEYIKAASEITKEYEKIMDDIRDNPNDLSNIELLTFNDKFISVFNNLADLQQEFTKKSDRAEKKAAKEWNQKLKIAQNEGKEGEFLDSEEGKNKPFRTTKALDNTVNRLNRLHKDYVVLGRDLIAQKLFSQYTSEQIEEKRKLKERILKKNPKDAYGLSLATTWQELAEQMKESSRDINFLERWTSSALGGSTNDLIALTSKMIIDSQEEVYDRLREHEELGEAHEKYAQASGINKNDVEAFNAPFLEEVSYIDANGDVIKVKEFISEFDMQRFSDNEAGMYKDIQHLKESNNKAWKKKVGEWYRANTVAKKNAKDIIKARKESMSEFEFKQWSEKNITDAAKGWYRGELVEPAPYYKSDKVKNLNSYQREYYEAIMSTMKKLKLLLPADKADRIGNMLPSVYKGTWEFASEGKDGFKQIAKDAAKMNEGDITYELVDLSGKSNREVPFHYTNRMDASITSSDILESLLKAAKAWETSNAKMKVLSEVQLIQDLAAYDTDGKLKVAKTTVSGENKINKLSSWKKLITKEGSTNIQERLDEVIKDLFYGIEEEKETFNVPIVGEVSGDKLTSTMLKATSIIQLSGAWISGSVNAIMGNLNNLIEAHSGEFVKKRNLAKGLGIYSKNIHHFLADRNKLTGKHWMTNLVEEFDLLHGEYVNSFGQNVSGNRLKKEAELSALMFLQTGAEHQINITNGLAFMDSVKWIDGKFVSRPEHKGTAKEFDSAKSLLDFYIEGKGKLSGEQAQAWTTKDRTALKHRVHEVNKYVQGNYAKEDRMGLQRRWYGKLAVMFRKYVIPGFARRYGKERYNHSTGTIHEGYYRTVGSAILNFVRELREETKNVGMLEALKNTEFSPEQRANLRRIVAEGITFFIVLAVVSSLTPDDDEEKNTYWENVSLLLARRMQSELSFYADPRETWRILKTPAVSMGTVESFFNFAGGLVFDWGEDTTYQRDTGIWEKGDSKDVARLTKLIPVLKGVLAGASPEEQLKVFNK